MEQFKKKNSKANQKGKTATTNAYKLLGLQIFNLFKRCKRARFSGLLLADECEIRRLGQRQTEIKTYQNEFVLFVDETTQGRCTGLSLHFVLY